MKSGLIALGLVSALGLAACGGNGDNAATTTAADNMTGMDMTADNADAGNAATGNAMLSDVAATPGQAFANTAGASDYYEVEAGKLAQEKATTQALKDFGAMMVTGHTDSTEKLKAAGGKASPAIVPNPALNAEQEANLAELRSATGAAFDAAYKRQQIAAHQKALAAMKDYAANGDVPELRAFAEATSKVVQMHLTKIQGM